MIDREKLNKILNAVESVEGICRTDVTIYASGGFRLWVTSKTYFQPFTEEDRHKVLSAMTPLVGKLEMKLSGTDKDYSGESDGITVYVNRADVCKVVGYKTTTKKVMKEIEKPVEYEEVEEEVREPITDCDIRQGRASEAEIEVPA